MTSSPSCRVEQGVTLHNSQPMHPPTRAQVVAILVSIYKKLKMHIIKQEMEPFIAEKYPQLSLQPLALLQNLLNDIESCELA